MDDLSFLPKCMFPGYCIHPLSPIFCLSGVYYPLSNLSEMTEFEDYHLSVKKKKMIISHDSDESTINAQMV